MPVKKREIGAPHPDTKSEGFFFFFFFKKWSLLLFKERFLLRITDVLSHSSTASTLPVISHFIYFIIKFRQSQKQWGRRKTARSIIKASQTPAFDHTDAVSVPSYFSSCYSFQRAPGCLKLKLQLNPVTPVQNNTSTSTELQGTPIFILLFVSPTFTVNNTELNFVTKTKPVFLS